MRFCLFLGFYGPFYFDFFVLTGGLTGNFWVLGVDFFCGFWRRVGKLCVVMGNFGVKKFFGFFAFDHCKPVGKCGIVYDGRNGERAGA